MFQAPVSMKSVLQAGWLLTVAFGNLIVVIVAEAKFFDSQVLFYVISVYFNECYMNRSHKHNREMIIPPRMFHIHVK
jgi:dipeptide/tripeptide permease